MDNSIKTATCPICGKEYTGHPALSWIDNKTDICPGCGIRQALDAAGIKDEAQEQIIAQTHQ